MVPWEMKGAFLQTRKKVAPESQELIFNLLLLHQSTKRKYVLSPLHLHPVCRRQLSFNASVKYSEVPRTVLFKCSDFIYYLSHGFGSGGISVMLREAELWSCPPWAGFPQKEAVVQTRRAEVSSQGLASLCRQPPPWGIGSASAQHQSPKVVIFWSPTLLTS